MGGNVTAAHLTYHIMKTTKEIIIDCLTKMGLKFWDIMRTTNNAEEWELAEINLGKVIKMKELIEKEN